MELSEHLDKIKAFVTVANAKKISKASVELNMSQPALTRQMQALEQSLSAKLFIRSPKGVELTAAGQHVYAYSVKVLLGLDNLQAKLAYPESENAGLISLGTYDSLVEYLWPPFIKKFNKTAPQIKVNIKTNMASPQKMLDEEQLDILIDAEPQIYGQLMSWALYEDAFSFFVSKKLAKQNPLKDLEAIPVIYSPKAHGSDNKTIAMHLNEKGYSFREKIELDSFTAVLNFCRKDMGLGILPTRLSHEACQKNEIIEIKVPGFKKNRFGNHSICATIKQRRKDDPKIALFLNSLRSHFK